MTYEEFIDEVKALNLKWKCFDSNQKQLRCENRDCPITALVRAKNLVCFPENISYKNNGKLLNLSDLDTKRIMFEADQVSKYSLLYKALIGE